jgi:hypothetical protein
METVCSDCGELLPDGPRVPCPNCSSNRRATKLLVEAGSVVFAGQEVAWSVSPPTISATGTVFAPEVIQERRCAAHFEFQLYYYPPEDRDALGLVQIDGIEHEPTEFLFGKSAAEIAKKLAEWFEDEC